MKKESAGLIAADIFAGAGGLTLGLKRGGFHVATAVELDQQAFSTYKTNHPEVNALRQDVRTVAGSTLRRLAGGTVHLLAGCPPCQGFSSLTNPCRRDDPRNQLVRDMRRLVSEVKPMAVMMENVPGLRDRGAPLLQELIDGLLEDGYIVSHDVLQLADYGVPQNRRRFVLLAGKGLQIPLPQPTHARVATHTLKKWRTLRDAIGGLGKAVLLSEANEAGGPTKFNWHVVRQLSPANKERLRAAKAGESRRSIPVELRPQCHKEDNNGYSNVYGRMAWNKLPVTITGGCTTLSKGRFGHPEELRTISVREAARIQTFLDSYVFDSPYMEYVCNMVGNALPCDFAELISAHVYGMLESRVRQKSVMKATRKRRSLAKSE